MLSTPLPDEVYQLAIEYELGEPIRVYRTNKRSDFKLFAWVIGTLAPIWITLLLIHMHFSLASEDLISYGMMLAILVFVALIFFISLLLIRKTTVYICSSGFIWHRGSIYQVVYWEEVEWVSSEDAIYTIYLIDQEHLRLSRFIEHLPRLAMEIELKSRLVNRSEEDLPEEQFEQMLNNLIEQQQEKMRPTRIEQRPTTTNEIIETTSRLQEEHQMGEIQATYYAGFKGLLHKEIISRPIHYAIYLIGIVLFLENFRALKILPDSLFLPLDYIFPLILVFIFLFIFYVPRFSARNIQLHIYTEGFIYIEGSSFEAVRWEQIEKVIYHKTLLITSPPFCHIYLPNGRKLEINGYMHSQHALKQTLNTHVANIMQIK